MFNRIKFAPMILACATCPTWSQISASEKPSTTSALNVPMLDASNSEFSRAFPSQESSAIRGTTSVKELEHPLEGKSLESLQKAQSLLAKGEIDKGTAILQKLTTDRAVSPYAFGILGTMHLRAGNLNAAVTALDAAVAMSPSIGAFHSNLALALSQIGRHEEGLKEARKALQLDPGQSKYRLVAGQILLALGRKEEAEFHLKKAAADFSGARELLAKYFDK